MEPDLLGCYSAWKNAHIYKYFITAKNVTFDCKITNGYAYTFKLHHYTCGCPVVELNMTDYTLVMTKHRNWTVNADQNQRCF